MNVYVIKNRDGDILKIAFGDEAFLKTLTINTPASLVSSSKVTICEGYSDEPKVYIPKRTENIFTVYSKVAKDKLFPEPDNLESIIGFNSPSQ